MHRHHDVTFVPPRMLVTIDAAALLDQRALWWQLLRLALSAIGPQTRLLARLSRETLYAAWWWVTLAGAFLLGSLAVLILPRVAWRWSALRWIGRGALAAMGVP